MPRILQAVAVIAIMVTAVSCRTYRDDYPEPRPRPVRTTVSLILTPTPGFVMNRHANGRYFHRGQYGYIYWKGYDNRFYLDRQYLNRVYYNTYEYQDWKHQGKNKNKNRNRRSNW